MRLGISEDPPISLFLLLLLTSLIGSLLLPALRLDNLSFVLSTSFSSVYVLIAARFLGIGIISSSKSSSNSNTSFSVFSSALRFGAFWGALDSLISSFTFTLVMALLLFFSLSALLFANLGGSLSVLLFVSGFVAFSSTEFLLLPLETVSSFALVIFEATGGLTVEAPVLLLVGNFLTLLISSAEDVLPDSDDFEGKEMG